MNKPKQESNSFEQHDSKGQELIDSKKPVVVKWPQVEKAMNNIKGKIVRTPFTKSRLSEEFDMELYFKKDYMQFTGSFKERGALNALLNLDKEQKSKGVITSSAGNHAQGLAYHGMQLGIPVTVVMPLQTPLVKVNSCKKLKATIVLHGNQFDESLRYSQENKGEKILIHGFDNPDVIAGQGTIAIEILEEIPDLDYMIVPIGGGGLIAGISVAVKHLSPKTKIIGVESDQCPSWKTALAKGSPVVCVTSLEGSKYTIADGLGVAKVGYNTFATAKSSIDKVVTVSEDYVALAILKLLEHEKAVVEGAGAISFAAILAGELPELKGKKVASLLCGGNIDASVLGRVIDRGLYIEGRLCQLSCFIYDRSSELAALTRLIGSSGANIKDVIHERISLRSKVHSVLVRCIVETRDMDHARELRSLLEDKYGSRLVWK